jgi:branched-chain amino acid transport system substrate-binding protein
VAADYEKLINQDGVDLVFGPFSTRLVVPAAQVAKDYGFLFVEPAGAAEEVFTQGFDNLFYAAPAVADDHYNYLADAIEALPEGQRPKTAAYAAMDDPFAMGTAYGLKTKLEAMGVETVVDEVYPPNTTDFGSIAAKIADSKADVVVGGTQYQDAVNMIVSLRQLGYQPKMAAFSTAPTNPEFPEAIGDETEGILSPTGYTPEADYPTNPEFVEFYTEAHGTAPGEDEANAWTTGQVVAAAVEAVECASPDPECQGQLIDWLRDNEVDTVVGPLTWDAEGRPEGAHLIQQYVDGKIRIVLPEEAKEADLILEKPTW